jgi:hypothetical protein
VDSDNKKIAETLKVIDAMDLLYAGALDGFCIVSSDSDFTPLASRIRENGLSVYGFGKKKTPEAFKKACDKFIYIENLISDSDLKNNEEEDIVDSDNKKIAETLKVIDQKMSSQSKERAERNAGWNVRKCFCHSSYRRIPERYRMLCIRTD